MNKLIDNLLKIYEKLDNIQNFAFLKVNIESLDQSDRNYQTLVENTDQLLKVLDVFSKPLKGNDDNTNS